MLRTPSLALLLLLPVLAPAPRAQAAAPQEPAPAAKPQVYDPEADAAAELAAALARADQENRRVLVQWGGNWCSWCILLHERFQSDRELRSKLLYEYEIVHVDIGRFDKNMELAAKFGADLRSHGVPFLTVLDAQGKVLANQETAAFEKDQEGESGHDPSKLLAFLTTHQAPYRDAEELLSGALAAAGRADKRVMLTFGAPWCGWCHRLEGVLARAEIGSIFSKDFVVQKIDIDRTLGGADLLERFRKGRGGGIPWFVFLEPDGKAVVDSTGPAGNLGCPYTDEEIEAFGEVLRKAVRRISEREIGFLQGFLAGQRSVQT